MKISESYDLSWYTKILMLLKPIPLASHYSDIQLKKMAQKAVLKTHIPYMPFFAHYIY